MTTTCSTATLLRAEVTPRQKYALNRWGSHPTTGKVRVYVSVTPEFPEPSMPLCGGSQKCGYYGPAACGEVDHDVWTRNYVRPGLAEQRALLVEALGREAFEALGTLTFSRKAGCSCGCSPGFVGTTVGTTDLFVTLEVAR